MVSARIKGHVLLVALVVLVVPARCFQIESAVSQTSPGHPYAHPKPSRKGAVGFVDEGAYRAVAEARHWLGVVAHISVLNALTTALRPDPLIDWTMRIPRVLWEYSIATFARLARNQESPSVYLLLTMMLITTALVDIFVWAPIFAAMADFKTCQGGWLTGEPYGCVPDPIKGYGRLFVVFQSVIGGLIYLLTGITTWHVYTVGREERMFARQKQLVVEVPHRSAAAAEMQRDERPPTLEERVKQLFLSAVE